MRKITKRLISYAVIVIILLYALYTQFHSKNDFASGLDSRAQPGKNNFEHQADDGVLRFRPNNQIKHGPAPDEPQKKLVPWWNLNKAEESKYKDWHNYQRIAEDAKRTGPGEQGKPYQLSREEEASKTHDYRLNGFNAHVSDMISVDRAIPDIRNPRCKDIQYLKNLPNASIVVPFYNEALSTLKRTVHSVINRSPPELIHEIILVDDFSDHLDLKDPLDDYMQQNFPGKVRLARAEKREGLIRARLIGADLARGQVLLFLDSHCEANNNWLPPLLERIAIDRTTVPCPMIDVISHGDFHYETQHGDIMRGAFDWELYYKRIPINDAEKMRRKYDSDPLRSPIMAGGLFAIDRFYFQEIGSYDKGLDIWGGEQYDLSFKIWMCGGSMEEIPCSRVGHIYRKFAPYSSPPGTLGKNLQRVVEVWMDPEYKKYFYHRKPHLKGKNFGDITELLELKKKLKCKSFDWFMKEIAPDILQHYPPVEPESSAHGAIESQHVSDHCVDAHPGSQGTKVQLRHCSSNREKHYSQQYFTFSWHHDIVVGNSKQCFDFPGGNAGLAVSLYPCHGMKGNQLWVYHQDLGLIHHPVSNLCLDSIVNSAKPGTYSVITSKCSKESESQRWIISNVNQKVMQELAHQHKIVW